MYRTRSSWQVDANGRSDGSRLCETSLKRVTVEGSLQVNDPIHKHNIGSWGIIEASFGYDLIQKTWIQRGLVMLELWKKPGVLYLGAFLRRILVQAFGPNYSWKSPDQTMKAYHKPDWELE